MSETNGGNGNGVPALEAVGVTKQFGGLTAVSDVTFIAPERSIVSIIGPNGAGKTTFFNMLTGFYKPTLGRIAFHGRNVTGGRPDVIMKLGMARTFQNIRLFSTMSAVENCMVGQNARMKAGLFGSIWGVVLGAITLSILNNWIIPDVINDLPSKVGDDFDMTQITFAIYGFLLLMMMIMRPQGLLPERRHKMELAEHAETSDETLYTARA
jgi:ABC-type Fe3+/spermidine/putrescine transport system ATPase subunit